MRLYEQEMLKAERRRQRLHSDWLTDRNTHLNWNSNIGTNGLVPFFFVFVSRSLLLQNYANFSTTCFSWTVRQAISLESKQNWENTRHVFWGRSCTATFSDEVYWFPPEATNAVENITLLCAPAATGWHQNKSEFSSFKTVYQQL